MLAGAAANQTTSPLTWGDSHSVQASSQEAQAGLTLLRTLWQAWNAYARRAGGYQGELLLTIVYFAVLGPSALIARLTGASLLDLSTRERGSYWIARGQADKTLIALQREF